MRGGPSHIDMWDMKPEAPSEFRGEFSPISTNVSGLQCCELMPRLAKQADQYTVIRSVVGTYEDHSSYHTQTGWGEKEHKSVGGFPSIGCQPCTSAVAAGEDPRSGRWKGKAKKECGLHVADDKEKHDAA